VLLIQKAGVLICSEFQYVHKFHWTRQTVPLSGVWGKAKSFNGWGILACDGGFSFMAFVGTPLASLLGYEFGIRGINLGLLPLAVFLGGAAIFGYVFRLAGSGIHYIRVKAAPPDAPTAPLSPSFRERLGGRERTELKLDIGKHT
jgi:hypothetical protein